MADKSFLVSIILKAEDKASKQMKGLSKWVKGNKTQFAAVGVAATAMGVAAVVAATKAAQAAGVQQQAEILLGQAMQQAGNFTEQAFKRNLEYASSLQKVTTFGDEAILGVQRMLTNFGLEGEMLNKVTKATLDLATAKGMDLTAAADLVAKSVGSSTNALTRYGIEVDGAAGSTERAQSAVENITKIFGGAAQAQARTYLGRIQQLNNRWGDIVETVGNAVIPIFEKIFVVIERNILPALESFSIDGQKVEKVGLAIASTFQFLIKVVMGLVTAFKVAGTGIASLLLAMTGNFSAAKKGFLEMGDMIMQYGETVKDISASTVQDFAQSSQTSLDIVRAMEEERRALTNETAMMEQQNQMAWVEGWRLALQETSNNMINFKEHALVTINGVQTSISTGFQHMLVNMGKGWKGFADGMQKVGEGIRNAIVKYIADIAAEWIVKTVAMTAKSVLWGKKEIAINASVAASKAAAASAWTLFGAVAIAAAIFAAVMAYQNQFANGVTNFAGGTALVGERGPELVSLPAGSSVFSNRKSAGMLAGAGGGMIINVNLSGNYIMDESSAENIAEVVSDVIVQRVKDERNI